MNEPIAGIHYFCDEAGNPGSRFAEEALAFYDPDGLKLELVAHAEVGGGEPRTGGPGFILDEEPERLRPAEPKHVPRRGRGPSPPATAAPGRGGSSRKPRREESP